MTWAISTRVPCDKRDLNYDKYFKDGDTQRNVLTEFNSNNTELLNVEQVQRSFESALHPGRAGSLKNK